MHSPLPSPPNTMHTPPQPNPTQRSHQRTPFFLLPSSIFLPPQSPPLKPALQFT